MYYLYILKSRSANWYYVGITDNVSRRIFEHNKGKTKSTKAFVPLDLVYSESYDNKTNCRKREIFLKKNHAAKKALIEKINMALSSNG